MKKYPIRKSIFPQAATCHEAVVAQQRIIMQAKQGKKEAVLDIERLEKIKAFRDQQITAELTELCRAG